jgi:hypothetical protein
MVYCFADGGAGEVVDEALLAEALTPVVAGSA